MKLFVLPLVAFALAIAAAQQAFGAPRTIGTGVVVIDTNLAYQGAQAAGTGMVLTSNGEVLTNNHVIEGATTVTVVVPGTSHHYAATVLGYSVAKDVAVLKLKNASNLKTVSTRSTRATLGEKVRALGNAGGTGSLVSAAGRVIGLGRTITASDDSGSSETLQGLIETNADVQAGDSGGPLLDTQNRVVGMDTAASRSGGFTFQNVSAADAYAIPIGTALSIAHQITAGTSSATVHVGGTAFMGIEVQDSDTPGALIAGVVPNGPAAAAGLQAGDLITALDGRTISQPTDVSAYLQTLRPGAKVTVAYEDQFGTGGTVAVTLGSGPPQ